MLWHTLVSSASLLLAPLAAASPLGSAAPNASSFKPNADGKYDIESEGIRASFIPYGAAVSNFWVKDANGVERDIVLGFDNASYYKIDKMHPFLGGLPGRYANRIRNSTFTIDGVKYNIPPNEFNNNDTLHGGPNGWDWRDWDVVAHTKNSITFSLFDPDGEQGFPGDVIVYATYTLVKSSWHIKVIAKALTKKTPIMVTSHVYWNLDGFANPDSGGTTLNHTFHMPYGGSRLAVDGILIPTGGTWPNLKGSVNDFWSAPKQLGANLTSPAMMDNCQTGCVGYDTGFLVNREGQFDWRTSGPVATISSAWSGIKLDIHSDQELFQIYSCPGQNGTLALKKTQGIFGDTAKHPRVVPKYGCVVLEVQDWNDAINHPEWNRMDKHIFSPETGPYILEARYDFSTIKK